MLSSRPLLSPSFQKKMLLKMEGIHRSQPMLLENSSNFNMCNQCYLAFQKNHVWIHVDRRKVKCWFARNIVSNRLNNTVGRSDGGFHVKFFPTYSSNHSTHMTCSCTLVFVFQMCIYVMNLNFDDTLHSKLF